MGMLGYYRIGTHLPADVFVAPPAPECVIDVYEQGQRLYDIGSSTIPGAVENTMFVSNLVTRQKGGNPLSYYRQGAEIGVTAPWLTTPGGIWDQMMSVQGEALTLGRELIAARKKACTLPGDRMDFGKAGDSDCAKLNRFMSSIWSPYLNELKGFINRYRGFTGWIGRNSHLVWETTQDYRARLIRIRRAAESIGGVELVSPEPVMPDEPLSVDLGKGLGKTLMTLLYVAIGGVVLWLVVTIAAPMLKARTAAAAVAA